MCDVERKQATGGKASKDKETEKCRNCGKRGHTHRICRGELTCFYCKERDYRKFDCPSLKKGTKAAASSQPTTVRTAAAISLEASSATTAGPSTEVASGSIAAVQEVATDTW
ncbi:uncharacterized protein [Anoplolepis gracilipes]|uniref:uncharacterized protein n=1 Tax=Anoplolepis gracilipes TaxID=354296 RepID=UPI003B9F78A3